MKIISIVFLLVLAGTLVSTSICRPDVLSNNHFLENFINHEILNILAVIMTIAIATIAIIHIWFNELEDKHQKKVFGPARREVNQAAYFFVGLFVIELVLLIVRSFPLFSSPTAISLFNSAALLILFCSVITLIDIMGVVRSLTPDDD